MNFENLKKHKKWIFAAYLIVAFFMMIAIWYAPILFKGYPAQGPEAESIVLGRNYAQSGVLGIENKLNVVMAPDKLDRVQPTTLGNRFTAYSYSVIFNLFGWQSWDRLILISILLYALGAIFLTITVYHLFGLRVAVLFPPIYALLPFNGQVVQALGGYEFTLFYFALFTLFYFWGKDQKYKMVYLFLSGLFLALSCLSKEAMFVFLPIFFFWLLYRRKKQEIIAVYIPVGLLIIIFWLPSFLGISGSNFYSRLFLSGTENDMQWSNFGEIGGSMDPYTFHFDKDSVDRQLAQIKSNLFDKNSSFLSRINVLKSTGGMFKQFNFFDYFIVGTFNLTAHLSSFLAIESVGGPIIFLLMILGFWQLKKQKKEFYYFFVIWLIGTVLILSYVILVIRNHLMDFGWVIAVLVALGLASIFPLLKNYFQAGRYSKFVFFGIVLLVLYSLVLADHVYLGRGYDSTSNLAVKYLAQKVNGFGNIDSEDVIAVGDFRLQPILNYLTGKSVVFFLPSTIDKLVKEQRLQEAFDQFGVKYIIGFNQDLSDSITKNSAVANIAAWPQADQLAKQISYNKIWLLNIVK